MCRIGHRTHGCQQLCPATINTIIYSSSVPSAGGRCETVGGSCHPRRPPIGQWPWRGAANQRIPVSAISPIVAAEGVLRAGHAIV